MGAQVAPHPEPSPQPSPPHPAGFSRAPTLSTLFHTLNLHWVICFTYGNIHVSIFSQIISPLPSPTEPKSLFFTLVSLITVSISFLFFPPFELENVGELLSYECFFFPSTTTCFTSVNT